MAPKHSLTRHLMRLATRCKQQHKKRSFFDTAQINPTDQDPENAIIKGYHVFPSEHSLDHLEKNAPQPPDLGKHARWMDDRVNKRNEDASQKNVHEARFRTRDMETEGGVEMRDMKEQKGKKEDCKSTPAATPTSQECGEQAKTQNQQKEQPQQQPPPSSRIKPEKIPVKKSVHFSDPLRFSSEMITMKTSDPEIRTFPEPFVISRKPVLRKPVPPITVTGDSNVLRAKVKNTALEAFLLLFALGAFGACTVCFVVMQVLSRW